MLQPIAGQLERYMDWLSSRQKLVASNIVNATGGAPRATEVTGLPVQNDGNNVSLDREARLLAENAPRFHIMDRCPPTRLPLSPYRPSRSVSKLSLIHISEPTRRTPISYAVFCSKKQKL